MTCQAMRPRLFGRALKLFAATVLGAAISGQAAALTSKAFDCRKFSDPNGQYKTITVDLRTIYVHESISDPGDDFEFKTFIGVFVYKDQDKFDNVVSCGPNFSWGEVSYDKPNLWTGDYKELNHGGKIVIANVPMSGMAWVSIRMEEIDGGANPDDSIDLSPRPDEDVIKLLIYPNQDRAYVVTGQLAAPKVASQGPDSVLRFGREKRFQGDGRSIVSIDDAIGLSLVVDGPRGVPVPSTSSAVTSTAAKEKACRDYALKAVEQNREASKNNCGYRPPEWSNNHQGHFDWCMRGNNPKVAPNETARRQKLLNACIEKAAVSKEKTCRDYALKAVEYNREADVLNCGFNPPVWSYDHQNHFDWCMRGNNSGQAAGENAKRRDALQRCRGQASKRRKTFANPRLNGAIVDNCVTFGANCDGGGAQEFCRLNGFARATAWQHNRPGRTYVIGSQRYCDGIVCVGYQSITCER